MVLYNKTMRIKDCQSKKEYNTKLKERYKSCTFCPFHGGENKALNEYSKYGKKKAAKRQYATGKHR